MHRFPNPGSTIENFIAVYVAAYEALHGRVVSLDDIVEAVVKANLATSSGYMGAEAVQRSTRADRSRDPLYNQLKMYAELFRVLGWLQSTEKSKLNYTFTLLGKQIQAAARHRKQLFCECALGIVYPNRVLSVKGSYELRPFAFILRTMLHAQGTLSRNEMIIGPLSAESDTKSDSAERLAREMVGLRQSEKNIAARLAALAKQRETQVNTLYNYTRWPLAVMKYCGWITESTARYKSGRQYRTWALTDDGAAVARRLETMRDVRLHDIDRLGRDETIALAMHAHFAMLARAGFDISRMIPLLQQEQSKYLSVLRHLNAPKDREVLFSPFQTLSVSEIEAAFPDTPVASAAPPSGKSKRVVGPSSTIGRGSRDHLFVTPKMVTLSGASKKKSNGSAPDDAAKLLRRKLQEMLRTMSPEEAADIFVSMHATDNKTLFYPLITHLFQILGYRSEHSRIGVNYQRWDAAVWVKESALPVEIKSPTEEMLLSTKSVRQALENKIVLLSRGGLKTNRTLPSLIVGFKIPNERGDLSMLVDDILKAYDLRIGVIDLRTLALLAMRSITEERTIDPSQLVELCGFLNA